MTELVRMSLSIEKNLLERLEEMVETGGYANRSEFVRDMIRDRLVSEEWERDEETVGTITLLYQHDAHQIVKKLTTLQHDYHDEVQVSTHIHLDAHLCVEVIIVKGRAGRIKELADSLRQMKGVLHANLAASSTGRKLT